jgi:hypothetical protein
LIERVKYYKSTKINISVTQPDIPQKTKKISLAKDGGGGVSFRTKKYTVP